MADAAVVVVDPPPPSSTTDFDSALSIPPLDTMFFSQQHLMNNNCNLGDQHNDVDDLDFDFSFEDLCLPPSDLNELILGDHTKLEESNLLNLQPGLVSNFGQFGTCLNFGNFGSGSNVDQFHGVFKSTSAELRHLSGDANLHGDHSLNGSGVLKSSSPALESHQISGYLNVPSPESDGSNRGSSANCVGDAKGLNYPSPDTQGSGNCESNVSEDSNNCATRSVSSSPSLNTNSIRVGIVDQDIKLEESGIHNGNSSLLKRKKESEDLTNNSNVESISKYRKSDCNADNDNNSGLSEEEEKKKARLIRNRESAQLSRQRKKHYVEELEDKVRMMHSTIQELNAKISYFMAENVTLRQQMGGGAGAGAGAAVPPPQMAPPPPGMYPHPAMMYPWMPCAPPYVIKPQGSQVPLVPIPRLKPQQPTPAPKACKKNDGPKTKKVAGVSFLGLLFFIMLFGGLVPMVNVRYGGVREALTGGESYVRGGFYEKHRGRVLMVNGTEYGEKFGGRRDFGGSNSVHCGQRGRGSGGEPSDDEFARVGNGSEPLIASLYVPRNDKLVKIDGNLIIHSVLASEKAMASNEEGDGETGLAFPGDLAPAIPVPGVGRNGVRNPHLRALGSSSAGKENLKSTANDGRLQQWFREGLAGPMLSSGMCTEVFQFDVSAASASGSIIPASASRNISEEQNQNSTHLNKGRNRRFLHDDPIPLPGSSRNTSKEHKGRNSQKENLNGNNLVSSMVVSVLVDPRETGDGDVDGVMGTKSVSRIFVVVLIDSVRYVTYSCMLPFMGSTPHLVTN